MRVFLYCRVAHDDSFSLEAQAHKLQRYATQAGYTIIGIAAEHCTGMSLDRPALYKVTQAILDSEVDLVVVDSISRIGRDWGMTQSYIELLTQHKVKLLCVKEQLMIDGEGVTLISNNKKAKCP